jgi:hypothetical protein
VLTAIGADNANVYWTENGLGAAVMTCPASGCPLEDGGASVPTIFALTPQDQGLAVNTTGVYWASDSLYHCPLTGCPVGPDGGADPTAFYDAGGVVLSAVAANSDHVFWIANGTSSGPFGQGLVLECPVSGCVAAPDGGIAPSQLAIGQNRPMALAVDDKDVYWVNLGTTGNDGTLMMSADSGPPVVVASNQAFPFAVALAPKTVYWATDNAVMKIAR